MGRVSGAWRYQFQASVELRASPDSPGRFSHNGEEYPCIVLAIEGHEIIVGVDVDLGSSVRAASLAVDASFLIERLLSRLTELEGASNPAGDAALGLGPVRGTPVEVLAGSLNAHQREAVASALGRSCTFLWGPPGTGKTHTIGAIASTLRTAGQRTLVVSHTNIAVDQAVLATDAASPPQRSSTSLLRVGVPRDKRLVDRSELLADHHLRERQRPLVDDLKVVSRELRKARALLAGVDRAIALRRWLDDVPSWRRSVEREHVAVRHHEAKRDQVEKMALVAEARALQERQRDLGARARDVGDLVARARKAGRVDIADAANAQLKQATQQLREDTEAFQRHHGRRYDDLLSYYDSPAAREERLEVGESIRKRRSQLRRQLDALLDVPRAYGLVSLVNPEADVAATFGAVVAAVSAETSPRSVEALMDDAEAAARAVANFEVESVRIETELHRVEAALLAEADVIGATLTAGFVRRALLDQRFDVVIIDEASMAQLPAVWCCGALADRVVVVGDFRQLAPVVIADTPAAEAWLGRDAFDIAGLIGAVDGGYPAPGLVALSEQRRMAPEISRLANRLAYRGLLTDGPNAEDDQELSGWLADGPWQDARVLAVDTQSFGSFASTARGSAGWSRANAVTATVSVALARAMLEEGRAARDAGDASRILIIAPYRPQADLLQAMLEAEGLAGEVTAGTVHSFQGSEASVVILDLTAAAPHHRIGLLSAANDDDNRRLLNVAITRARRRLVAVGDLAWLQGKAAEGSAAAGLLGDIQATATRIDVKAFLAEQRRPVADGDGLWIADSEGPQATIREAIESARRSVVIYSPRIDARGIDHWGALLQQRHRDIDVLLVTAPPDSEQSRNGHRRLTEVGLPLVIKERMKERAVVVDGTQIALLDHHPLVGATRGTILWWRDGRAAEHLDQVIGGARLLRELERGGGGCPSCAVPLTLAEGNHLNPGPYWRCPRCRRTRQPSEGI